MATLRTNWLLSILLLNLPSCFVSAGTLASSSRLDCYFPCTEESCDTNIHCDWDPRLDTRNPTNYSLHWSPSIIKGSETSKTNSSGIIDREHFANHGKLCIWVEATSQQDSVKSHEGCFNLTHIMKPPPPKIKLMRQMAIEIEWDSFCNELQDSVGSCDYRYRIEGDQVWIQEEGIFVHSHEIGSPLPCRIYELQVRCACKMGLKSDWSTIHRIRSAEMKPFGKPDIWWDYGISPARSNYTLTLKNLAKSQTCSVQGYEASLLYNNGTVVHTNLSGLLCSDLLCYLNASFKDVRLLNVSAFNAHGATEPSPLLMPISGEEKDEQILNLTMNEANLTVSWNQPSQHTDNLKEYVVQFKQAGCPPGKGFGWVKVLKNQTTAFLKGHFEKYTAFKVSLYSVSDSLEVHHLSSAIGYSLEGTPPSVQFFEVVSITPTQVTLFWKPAPLSEQNGMIRYYQIGLDKQNVDNVSASTQHENGTFQLKHLTPGQEYKVWIRAVTGAGPGGNYTVTFKTMPDGNYVLRVTLLAVIFLVVISIFFSLCCYFGINKVCPMATCFWEKVPDPSNSHIFKQKKHQMNESFDWICISFHEKHPNISMLEIVETLTPQPRDFIPSAEKKSNPDGLIKPLLEDGCSHMDAQDDQIEDATKQSANTGPRHGRKEYSKIVDSDEEKDKDDCLNSADDEVTSGYERHFMPTASEIMQV
ncbi:interleukin 12 receptor, beta 2a, like isoform X2 [Echeneis naucrates]|uniref:Granulocyte colony-stimulating factor receptor-like n=1 Tax=Echeneis naucrates TaxID=173247 RepID=A0A665UHX0_ECHNA|nr:granulocyte colony-stimulating factor receptor-like isoform X1 [Echeneis naucrates]XP_029365343.1 granulocyte colony-stimulating factor receptor-like isoform X2 [Echeneis naucrates]